MDHPTDEIEKRERLRYKVVCSIDAEPGVGWFPSTGYTDDLGVAIWHAEHSPYPGWEVYDLVEGKYIGSGPPDEHVVRSQIQDLIYQMTTRWWQKYPYAPVPGDVVGERHREQAQRDHEEAYPDWRPTSEWIVAPLRVAFYRALAAERSAAESKPPGKLAIYPDGRDLEPGWES